jgi:APA family basic amino acid/polyamine antiporter
VLRIREPNLPRPFKTPLVWFVAPMGALSAAYLMAYLDQETWIRLLVWLVIGLTIYFLYSRKHSRLAVGSGE